MIASDGATGIELPPFAPMLMQSLRAVGYTLGAALADLVDNSVAAGARNISIDYAPGTTGHLAILDDGRGMDPTELVAAMRFGSRDPRDARGTGDLGRFGLGLKTASLSQARRLTVASRREGQPIALARWDLDECERRGAWWLEVPRVEDLPGVVQEQLGAAASGTAVVWQSLDRLGAEGPLGEAAFERAVNEAGDHLALAFHRFIAAEVGRGLSIRINGRALPRLDPFLHGHARGQALHEEVFEIEGEKIRVSPFVLPLPSRLGEDDLAKAGGRDMLKTAHGFYIYRGGRLVVPGGWFGIVPADELVRLARVRVDVPVSLDHLWRVDIRKATAAPPAALRPHLKRIVGDVATRSRRVYSHRGTPAAARDQIRLWGRVDGRDGAATWKVNRQHPVVAAALAGSSGSGVERLLRLLEDAMPVHDIHLHVSNDLPVAETGKPALDELRMLARDLLGAFQGQPAIVAEMLAKLPMTYPFSADPEAARMIVKELSAP